MNLLYKIVSWTSPGINVGAIESTIIVSHFHIAIVFIFLLLKFTDHLNDYFLIIINPFVKLFYFVL